MSVDRAPARRLTLVLGGARSGKSRHAEALIEEAPSPWLYVATAEAFDDEMRERIALHRSRRDGGWRTHEAPLALADTLAALSVGPLLIDCLTLWLSNHLLAGSDIAAESARLEQAIAARSGPTVAVANEVGLGIVPDNALARRFRDEAGRLNQRLAARADRVLFMVAGLPMVVKDEPGERR
ncbi:bifunctional adenosylcobinamide kinase/adenosylcobinamide-phosphate guanylyltransferase [Chelatococcus reniformis]|uniref:Bifunctional adenosylcobalamin biosynthesis protein n=1 Tax=Chelatococcus reniformis TaxID=1494448 RepID=A0A916UZ41_9HYPH|nr:bifunctional adenosylcobinamide kinase/adenosylcobinamide-phosphate guanylyltransferase [Chelatococcus reniformis]GGC92543.1 adenosylcobinamide kinase/adenosylcobinamide phosphate guanyltransferase [Chelatococcus reniformis]